MSYVDFEVDGIEYRLILSKHGSERDEPVEGLDAIVKETCNAYDSYNFNLMFHSDPELDNYYDLIKEKKIPVYSVDNLKTNNYVRFGMGLLSLMHLEIPIIGLSTLAYLTGVMNTSFVNFYGIAVGALILRTLIPNPLSTSHVEQNKLLTGLSKINSCLTFIEQDPITELRNALAAKKIKKGVVPRLLSKNPEKFSRQQPKIGIIYGAAHSGIKECLQNDWRTEFTLKLHKYYGIPLIFEKESMSDIYEMHITEDNVRSEKFEVDFL